MSPVDLDFERSVLDGLGRILLSERDLHRAHSTALQVARRRDEVVPVLFKHKVVPIATTNLEKLLGDGPPDAQEAASALMQVVKPAAEIAQAHRTLIEREAAEFAALIPSLGAHAGNVAVLKGLCNARFYPPPYVRWMRDLDVFVSTWESAVVLLNRLLDAGFEYDSDEHPWIKGDLARGRDSYGQVFLIRSAGDDFSRVDIHFGTYSAGFSGYLRAPLTDRLDSIRVGGESLPVLRPERALLVAQAHALSDGYVAVKDINDFVGIAVTQDVDWQEVASSISDHELEPQARLLAEHVQVLYDDPRVVRAAAALCNELPPKTRGWRLHDRDWNHRARVNAGFTYRWHRSIGDGMAHSLTRCAQCFAFYVRRLQFAVRTRTWRERLLRRFMPESDLARWQLRPECCTLLIDVDALQEGLDEPNAPSVGARACHSEGVEWLSVDGYDVLRVQARVYVPTLDLIVDPAHVQAALGLARMP